LKTVDPLLGRHTHRGAAAAVIPERVVMLIDGVKIEIVIEVVIEVVVSTALGCGV
jgi:hypothetical protein